MDSTTWAVITSIHIPRRSTLNLLDLGWSLVVVADHKTPNGYWENVKHHNFHFLNLESQSELFPELHEIMGTGTYARKNLGYLYAIKSGASAIWDTDDDTFIREAAKENFRNLFNLPTKLILGSGYFNPYTQFAEEFRAWPRGFPLSLVSNGKNKLLDGLSVSDNSSNSKFDVLQTLVDEEPDVDAIYRLTVGDSLPSKPVDNKIFVCNQGVIAPANTQSTLWINSSKFSFLYVPNWVSFRFCDILKMYVAQSQLTLAYSGFWTRQERNPHDYLNDFESEIQCYLLTELAVSTIQKLGVSNLSGIYQSLIEIGVCTRKELEAAQIFENYVNEFVK